MKVQFFVMSAKVILISCLVSIAWGAEYDVFGHPAPMEFFLKAKDGSFRELFSKRAVPNKPTPPEIENFKIGGELIYTNPSNEAVTIPVEIQLRGNTSQAPDQCPFPKLKLKFKAESTAGTFLEGHKEIGIATHCNLASGSSERFSRVWGGKSPHREALIYQMLEVLQIPSFKARLAYGTYFENDGQVIASMAQAFFLEDMSTLLKRLNGREIRGADVKPEMRKTGPKAPPYSFNSVAEAPGIDLLEVTRILFFQNLIRNNDFHLRLQNGDPGRSLWNMKAVELNPQKWMVFPYDFDLAGVVRGSDKNRKTADLRERIHVNLRNAVGLEFEAKQRSLYQVAEHLKANDPEGYDHFRKRLDDFYKELNSLKN